MVWPLISPIAWQLCGLLSIKRPMERACRLCNLVVWLLFHLIMIGRCRCLSVLKVDQVGLKEPPSTRLTQSSIEGGYIPTLCILQNARVLGCGSGSPQKESSEWYVQVFFFPLFTLYYLRYSIGHRHKQWG